jgi:hypothetical protein
VILLTLSEFIVKTIKLINSYSNNGVLISPSNGNYQDYYLRMRSLADDCQKEIAKYIKIRRKYTVTQNPITNLLGLHVGFDITQHLPDKITYYNASGAKSFYFEADRPCTWTFEESNDNATWTPLAGFYDVNGEDTAFNGTINVTGNTSYKAIKGILTLTKTYVRVYPTSDYVFNSRNRALFGCTFPKCSDVPDYQPYIPYKMPSDFDELDKVVREYDQRQMAEWSDYKKIEKDVYGINWFSNGQFTFHYFAKPQTIDDDTSDDYEFEVEELAQTLIPYYVAGTILMTAEESQTAAAFLINRYDNKLANLSADRVSETPGATVTITQGEW